MLLAIGLVQVCAHSTQSTDDGTDIENIVVTVKTKLQMR